MDDRRATSSSDDDEDGFEFESKNYLKEFILSYENCTALWNPKDNNYMNMEKRNQELDKLLTIYKNIKPNAKRDDVRKKINSLRSNYRKELKKIENSITSDQVYKPKSSTFHLLQFLSKDQKRKRIKDNDSSEIRSVQGNSLSSIKNESPTTHKRKKSITLAKQNTVSSQDVNPLVMIWIEKLKSLDPTQKLYAEKAINDVLFEAQLSNLHRESIRINASEKSSYTFNCSSNTSKLDPLSFQPKKRSPSCTEAYQTGKKEQSGPPSKKNHQHKFESSESEEDSVGSLFATFKST